MNHTMIFGDVYRHTVFTFALEVKTQIIKLFIKPKISKKEKRKTCKIEIRPNIQIWYYSSPSVVIAVQTNI